MGISNDIFQFEQCFDYSSTLKLIVWDLLVIDAPFSKPYSTITNQSDLIPVNRGTRRTVLLLSNCWILHNTIFMNKKSLSMWGRPLRFWTLVTFFLKSYSSWAVNIDQLPRQRYDSFKCNGTEAFLSQCPSDGPYPYKCYSEGYAGVTCQNHGTSVVKILANAYEVLLNVHDYWL